MKRLHTKYPDLPIHIFLRDVEHGLSKDQLAGIGKIAILWADCDELMNIALRYGLRLPSSIWRHVVSGIAPNKKMALINICAKDLLLGKIFCAVVAKTVSAIGELGGNRDDTVHASVNVFELERSIGTNISRSGAKYDVLRTKEALDAISSRLSILRDEITAICEIFNMVPYKYEQKINRSTSESTAEAGQLIAPMIENLVAHQRRRESLPPLPKFPA